MPSPEDPNMKDSIAMLAVRNVRQLALAAATCWLFPVELGATSPTIFVAPPAEQIASAVLAAPDDRRAGARVLGYVAGPARIEVRELRAGTNDLVCLADH